MTNNADFEVTEICVGNYFKDFFQNIFALLAFENFNQSYDVEACHMPMIGNNIYIL